MCKTVADELDKTPIRVLLVSEADHDEQLLRSLLSAAAGLRRPISLDCEPTPEVALARAADTPWDVVVCDAAGDLPMRLLESFHAAALNLPLLLLSDHCGPDASVFNAGACDLVERATLNETSLLTALERAIHLHQQEMQNRKIEDTLRKLSQAVEQSADLVMITNREGVIEYVNPAFESLTGYSRREIVGRTPKILNSGKQSPELYRDLWHTILSNQVFRCVLADRKKNGEIYYSEKTITPVLDASGEITHFISNDRDITQRMTLERQLLQAQKMDAIGRLAGGVAHDFNNLLMVMGAYAELTLDAFEPGHPLRHNLQEILDASRRAATLTRQLLAFSRKQIQDLQVLDLNRVVDDLSRMLPRLLGEDIELEIVPQPNLGKVRADAGQIEQILMNLAANARDAMPGGGKLLIETSTVRLDGKYAQRREAAVPAGDYVMLAVSDSGEGIAAEHLPHIFEPFYTTKSEGKGTGLGLATVYGIVKQSGGFIWVYSEPGMGTTFKVYFPLAMQSSPAPAPLPLSDIEQAPGGAETILLVEDEDAVRHSVSEFLSSSGYHVLEARDGESALRVAADYPDAIHMMISDVVMPHMSGGQLAECLSQERPEMKLLFVSGYAEQTVLSHGVLSLAGNFLQKPFGLATLAGKVRNVLDAPVAVPVGKQ